MGFEHVWFVNGTAYAGKSTLVKALAEKYDGILCGENYHDALLPELDPAEFPNLCWSRDLEDWHAFIRRTPEEYEAWIIGVTKECEILELRILGELVKQGRPIFVDTNLSPETLRRISDDRHVLILLADPEISWRGRVQLNPKLRLGWFDQHHERTLNPDDHREYQLKLSDKGENEVLEFIKYTDEWEKELCARLGSDVYDSLKKNLSLLATICEEK